MDDDPKPKTAVEAYARFTASIYRLGAAMADGFALTRPLAESWNLKADAYDREADDLNREFTDDPFDC